MKEATGGNPSLEAVLPKCLRRLREYFLSQGGIHRIFEASQGQEKRFRDMVKIWAWIREKHIKYSVKWGEDCYSQFLEKLQRMT